MKYVILALALAAAVHAEDDFSLDDQSEARLLFSTNASSSSIIPDGRALLGFFLVLVLLFTLLAGGLPFATDRNYYDYEDAYAYGQEYNYGGYQGDQFNQRYGISNLATKMSQLETAFKKFEVETEECQMFVACEAAQIRKLARNVPVVQIVNRILSTRGEEEKLNQNVLKAFEEGLQAHNNGVPNVCAPLRERCYVAHNNQ